MDGVDSTNQGVGMPLIFFFGGGLSGISGKAVGRFEMHQGKTSKAVCC